MSLFGKRKDTKAQPVINSKVEVILEELTFSSGKTVVLPKSGIVLFTGGNNVGKSVALKNIWNAISDESHFETNFNVVKNVKASKKGSTTELFDFLDSVGYKDENNEENYKITKYGQRKSAIERSWKEDTIPKSLGSVFGKFSSTETRLFRATDAERIDFFLEFPSHPLHLLFMKPELELQVSTYFRRAFSTDLILDPITSKSLILRVGSRDSLPKSDKFSLEYFNNLRNLPSLRSQGDGMKSFAAIILDIVSKKDSILLIDEPESFLHPPQAKLLGELIGIYGVNNQIIVSTHSSDFIKGILSLNETQTKIVRLTRELSVNTISELNQNEIEKIWNDPTLKYSQLLDGLFHSQVFICESEGDCRFYSALIETLYTNSPQFPAISDSLFFPGHGVAKLPYIISSLRNLQVPSILICDFDVLGDGKLLEDIVTAKGGNWQDYSEAWKVFIRFAGKKDDYPTKTELKARIFRVFESIPNETISKKNLQSISSLLKTASTWDSIKRVGLSAVEDSDAHKACSSTILELNKIGIFPIPIGELESFDRSISRENKAQWLEEVFKRNFADTEYLTEAKDFISNVIKSSFRID